MIPTKDSAVTTVGISGLWTTCVSCFVLVKLIESRLPCQYYDVTCMLFLPRAQRRAEPMKAANAKAQGDGALAEGSRSNNTTLPALHRGSSTIAPQNMAGALDTYPRRDLAEYF